MKRTILNKEKNAGRYDWTLEHLKSRVRLKANPYLWTRIKAGLDSGGPEPHRKTEFLLKTTQTLRWVLPLLLVFTASFGVYIGFELSNDMKEWVNPGPPAIPAEIENYDLELIHEQSRPEAVNIYDQEIGSD